jgi:hypothetical protein
MWINKADYTALVEGKAKAETRADWLITRVNQLERELGVWKEHTTGIPAAIPIIRREATPPVDPEALGETSFDDMGDELAKKHYGQ